MKKNKKWDSKTFRWFMGLMGKRLPIYLMAIFLSSVGIAGIKVASSYLAKTVINAAQTKTLEGIYLSVFINFLAIVGATLVWRVGIVRYNIEAKNGIAKVEKMVFSKAMRLPMSYYEKNHSGDFMSKLIFDTERAGDIYGSRLRRISAAIITTIIYLVPMFYYNWALTLCLFALSSVTFGVNSLFIKPMKRAGTVMSKENGVMTEKLTNILGGIDLTKIFPIGRKLYRDYDDENQNFFKTQKKTNRLVAGMESLNNLFSLLGSLAFLGLGIVFVSYGWVGLGELAAIYTLYGSFQYSFLEIGKYLPQMVNCVANAQRVHEFLELEEESDTLDGSGARGDTETLDAGSSDDGEIVKLENISFAYSLERMILDNVSLSVKKGTSVAITGVSGRGKSTLAKLLLGFYKPLSGRMWICGKEYSEISLEAVRNCFSYVPQEPYLYSVSIAENIAYGRMGKAGAWWPTRDEIIEAAKAANAHDFIMQLPDGYDTIPGERGNQLSGGEKQRIAIARAIIKDAPVFLLDEATSALDNESERLVNEAISRLCKNRTTIMIAHRESTIAMADVIVEL